MVTMFIIIEKVPVAIFFIYERRFLFIYLNFVLLLNFISPSKIPYFGFQYYAVIFHLDPVFEKFIYVFSKLEVRSILPFAKIHLQCLVREVLLYFNFNFLKIYDYVCI